MEQPLPFELLPPVELVDFSKRKNVSDQFAGSFEVEKILDRHVLQDVVSNEADL